LRSCSLKGSKSFKRHVHVLSTSPIDSEIHAGWKSDYSFLDVMLICIRRILIYTQLTHFSRQYCRACGIVRINLIFYKARDVNCLNKKKHALDIIYQTFF